MIASEEAVKQAMEHLSKHDKVLAKVIAAQPVCAFQPHADYYAALVTEIIGQQLSTKAASAIRQRFLAAFGDKLPSPEQILDKSLEDLRATGISWSKARYVRDLAQHVVDGKVKFDHLDGLSNDEVIAELTAVKGIGEWTAHMFLIFCMGRLDVLPTGDLGIRNGIQKLYGLDHSATPDAVKEIAKKNNWHPYESVAAWYVWQALDNTPVI
jgi:DNA-3-methyladenine glycosylase II